MSCLTEKEQKKGLHVLTTVAILGNLYQDLGIFDSFWYFFGIFDLKKNLGIFLVIFDSSLVFSWYFLSRKIFLTFDYLCTLL